MAAYLIGMEAEATATWTRAYHEHLDRGDVERDTHALPFYELTTQIATLEPPPPEWAQLLGALQGNQEAMDGFVRVTAGVTSPAEFFSEENIGRMAGTRRPGGSSLAVDALPAVSTFGDSATSRSPGLPRRA